MWNIFLQVFDAGVLTDSQGKVASFSDTVIVLTSNMGARHFAERDAVGFLPALQQEGADERAVREEIKGAVAPELLNRLDGVLVFHPLAAATVRSIARSTINTALTRLADRGIVVDVTDALEDEVCELGFSREYGARPLQRVVERLVVRPVAGLGAGVYRVDFLEGEPHVTRGAADEQSTDPSNQP